MEILIDRHRISTRVSELAAEIRRDLGDSRPLHLVGVLKGSFVFLADLARALSGPLTIDFIAASSYAGAATTGEVRLTQALTENVHGRDVVLVEDIVDTGLTLSFLQETIRARHPRSLRTVTLLDKPDGRRVDVMLEYVGFRIPNRFVVGYGLDLDERFRELPDVAVWGGEERA